MKKLIFLIPLITSSFIIFSSGSIDKAVMERGKEIYTQYCVSCHQVDGGGVPGLNPPLEKTTYVVGSKSKLISVLLRGLNSHEEIDGETYSNSMPPFNFLNNQQISDVLTFIRNSFGNKASAITPGDVKYIRTKTK